jgi:hypothetical protein
LRIPVGEPLVLRVQLRNRSGLEKSVPAEFVRNDPKGPALHVGIRPRLFHAKAKADVNQDTEKREEWKELTLKATASFQPGAAAKTAAPGETFVEFQIDLARWFDITQAGAYRVQLDFNKRGGGLAIGSSQEIRFQFAEGRRLP